MVRCYGGSMDARLETYRKLPPLMVTYPELVTILQPLTMGYAWGEGTIRDLWLMGAPTPDSTVLRERRIVFPGQLAKWLEDVLTRQGRPLDDAAKAYTQLRRMTQ